MPLEKAKQRLKETVDTTLACGNKLVFLPGQKERESRQDCLANGVPLTPERVEYLKRVAANQKVGLPFDLEPISDDRSVA
jgi:LDH2 family malate/lactate/ureidoglycolate dehydrogenase